MNYALRVLENALLESELYFKKSKNAPIKIIDSIKNDIVDLEQAIEMIKVGVDSNENTYRRMD